jgi:hypothetical protein
MYHAFDAEAYAHGVMLPAASVSLGLVALWRGPTLGIADEHVPASYTTFHPVTVDPGGMRAISFVYHANPAACCMMGPGTAATVTDVTVRFTVLRVSHNTQTIPLGDSSVTVQAPPASACR